MLVMKCICHRNKFVIPTIIASLIAAISKIAQRRGSKARALDTVSPNAVSEVLSCSDDEMSERDRHEGGGDSGQSSEAKITLAFTSPVQPRSAHPTI